MLSNASRAARLSARKGCTRASQRAFGRSCPSLSQLPNAPIPLDPSMQALLNDVDMSLLSHKPKFQPQPRELEALEASEETFVEQEHQEEHLSDMERKSPAALFGSQRIGAVVIPSQLQAAVTSVIEDTDKSQLHADALRLFAKMDTEGVVSGWQMQLDTKYNSYQQGARHAERDAAAFVSIAMPGHYTAIYSVLDHLKQRMPPDFEIDRVIDWGSGTYSGLWASLYAFQQKGGPHVEMKDLDVARSTLKSYVGIDKRVPLVAVGNRLMKGIKTSKDLKIQHRKSIDESDNVPRQDGKTTIGLSAFVLSSLPTPIARKQLVKEMWESGAHTLILMDHDNKEGFEAIALAREYLLKLGRKEMDDPKELAIRGSHVVAPCSHNKTCPLLNAGSTRLFCGFNQRMQRPSFVRLTKHSKVGHEDVRYSYVVIQRGTRPEQVSTNAGRVGLVGARAIQAEMAKSALVKQLSLFDDAPAEPSTSAANANVAQPEQAVMSTEGLQEVLRQEAYQWPRLIVPPLKNSGHVILDSCTSEGKIMRLTIPKSQGKQPYYDARKSSWGDLFPHPPKNAPQERVVVHSASGKVKAVERNHIGKSRPEAAPQAGKSMYEMVKPSVREAKKDKRKWERVRKNESVWKVDE